jgi:hypothetical protein
VWLTIFLRFDGMVGLAGAVQSLIGKAPRITQHYPEIFVGSTAMPQFSKTPNSSCPAPPRASDRAGAVAAAAVEEILEGTPLSVRVMFVLESEMANSIIWMLEIFVGGILYWVPETRCRLHRLSVPEIAFYWRASYAWCTWVTFQWPAPTLPKPLGLSRRSSMPCARDSAMLTH